MCSSTFVPRVRRDVVLIPITKPEGHNWKARKSRVQSQTLPTHRSMARLVRQAAACAMAMLPPYWNVDVITVLVPGACQAVNGMRNMLARQDPLETVVENFDQCITRSFCVSFLRNRRQHSGLRGQKFIASMSHSSLAPWSAFGALRGKISLTKVRTILRKGTSQWPCGLPYQLSVATGQIRTMHGPANRVKRVP